MFRLGSLITATFFAASAALAQDRPIVVELYTSQGCSSCPPADAFLHELAKRDDVLPLALHVDYWDYIGWKDSFADPAHTVRQRAYARAGGERMIYTPQMIIDGLEHVVGNRPRDVNNLIKKHQADRDGVKVELARDGDNLTINATANPGTSGPLVVHLVRYSPEETVKINRGENAGRTLSYANIVTEMNVLEPNWNGRDPLQIETSVTGDNPVVVLVQDYGNGPIQGAARLR